MPGSSTPFAALEKQPRWHITNWKVRLKEAAWPHTENTSSV